MNILANLQKNESQMYVDNCIVDDIVELDNIQFENLKLGLMTYRPFIAERRKLMFKDNEFYHCILVLESEAENGILICSDGAEYALYSAFIPNARTTVNLHIKELANYIISEGTENTQNGVWSNSLDELYYHLGGQIDMSNGNGKRLLEELKTRPEVKTVTLDDEQINVIYLHQYCKNIRPEGFIEESVKGILEDKYNVNLVATYEELMDIQNNERLTEYFGDLSLYNYKCGVTEEQILPLYKKALETIEMSETEFLENKDLSQYRFEMVARMRDCLLAKTLLTGEEVLFVNSEPIAGEDDFGYKTGYLMEIDREKKTCTINGTYFSMGNVPVHNVLGRYNSEIEGMHYGYKNVEPLYDENDVIAQFYIYKSKAAWEQNQNNKNLELSVVDEKEFEIICAQHVLFMNDLDGGKQADFSGRIFEEFDFSSKDLINMNFEGTKFIDCIFDHSDISHSTFDGVTFSDCDCHLMTGEGASFRKAHFDSCDLDSASFVDSNFSYAEFTNNEEPESFENCCTHKIKLSNEDNWDNCFIDCIDNEKEWAAQNGGMNISIG